MTAPVEFWATAGGEPMPRELERALKNPRCEIHAWNAQFERLITKHVIGIDVPLERWHCTAAWARARGLPGKLEGALDFAGDEHGVRLKRAGNHIMMRWCKPLPDGTWANDPDEYLQLIRYCITDVEAERRLRAFLSIAPLDATECRDYWLTERLNDVGLPVDLALARAAARRGQEESRELLQEIRHYSQGKVTSAAAHGQLKAFLQGNLEVEVYDRFFTRTVDGVRKETTDAAARERFLASEEAKETHPDVIALLEAVDDANKSSVAKYASIIARADGTRPPRVQGAYLYAGAAQTKRFSSTGVQMHNLPRVAPRALGATVTQVLRHKLASDALVMHVLSACLRPTIKAPAGRVLVWGDWSAIEARMMPWLAARAGIPGAREKLQLYRDGIDVYKVNAEDIYGTPYDKVTDDERQVGKVAELSLQFGGWVPALQRMARNYRIELDDAQALAIAARWRENNAWARAYQRRRLAAYRSAAQGTPATVGPVEYAPFAWYFDGHASVQCTLPDGTRLFYPGGAAVEDGAFVYCKAAFNTRRDRERIWHGLLTKNVVQATCAALLRDCLRRLDATLPRDIRIVGHTHDEIILECPRKLESRGAKLLAKAMREPPSWAAGLPVGVSIATGERYTKQS